MSKSQFIPYALVALIIWTYTIFIFSRTSRPPASAISVPRVDNASRVSPLQNNQELDFPSKIWQTSRTFENPGLDANVESWLQKNPGHRYTRITQHNDANYLKETIIDDQHLLETALALKDGMLRADLIQYIFLYAEGGTYTDMDTVCLKPIASWLSEEQKAQANLVLGIEGDCLGGALIAGFSHCVQFATWTMMVKPRHPVMKIILDHVIKQIELLAEKQNTSISEVKPSYMDVMDTTGPGVFAQSIYQGLSEASGTAVSSDNLTAMTAPRLFGDILILPVTSFGAGMGHSNAGETTDEAALVKHEFMGSWKGDHPF